ncbi:MAG: RnfABCDGE type electron transport complex subunit C [Alphaproteobacteria bacterium]
MLRRRYGTFTGGIDLPDQKSATLNRSIVPAPRPSRLLVPLGPCGGPTAKPLVVPGQAVEAGQKLAQADDGGAVDVFAPLAGKVASLDAVAAVAGPYGFLANAAIELTDLGECPSPASPATHENWIDRPTDALMRQLRQGGLMTHRRPVEPLATWIDKAAAARCDVLIANAVEGQPYVTADHRLLVEHGTDVVAGLVILARALGITKVILAVDHRRTGSYQSLAQAAHSWDIATIALPHKYPIGADAVLVHLLTRRQVPPGGTPMDVSAAVIDPASCFAVFRWVVYKQQATHRVVTVAGEQAGRQENFWTPLGYPCAELVRRTAPSEAGTAKPPSASVVEPIIHGGPMVGLRCHTLAVVTPATDALLAIDEAPPAAPTPCIRCGWCTDHCPARLNVAILNDDFELSGVNHARRLRVAACVECGVCSYVCPARLPLTERVKQLKQATAQPAPVERT